MKIVKRKDLNSGLLDGLTITENILVECGDFAERDRARAVVNMYKKRNERTLAMRGIVDIQARKQGSDILIKAFAEMEK